MNTKLLLDIGNSRLKWALAEDGALRVGAAIEHHGEPATALATLPPQADEVLLSHVVGDAHEQKLTDALALRYSKTPRIARALPEFSGMRVAYADAQRLGVDRWLCMLAVWAEQRSAFCVAGAGTALTFDAVGDDGCHQGGVIAPGLLTAQRAVLGATRFGVRAEEPGRYDASLGRDTESCVRQGAVHSCAGLLDRLGARYPGRRVLTGGDAETLQPLLTQIWDVRANLVLEGLLIWSGL